MRRNKKLNKVIVPHIEVVLYTRTGNGFKTDMRILRWEVDNKMGEPSLEKRTWRQKKDGTYSEKGKASGFNKNDWKVIMENREEIAVFMQ